MRTAKFNALLATAVFVMLSTACSGPSGEDAVSTETPLAVATTAVTPLLPAITPTEAPTATPTLPPAQISPSPPATPAPTVFVPPIPPQPPAVDPTRAPAGSGSSSTSTPPPLPPGTRAVLAPIDKLEVRTLESFPPRYQVSVTAGLPSGCARRYHNSVTRDGRTFKVAVLNTLPTGNMACTAIYGIYNLNLNLPGSFISGQTYTVQVNDKSTTFRAQ